MKLTKKLGMLLLGIWAHRCRPTASGQHSNSIKKLVEIKIVIISFTALICVAVGTISGGIAGYINTAQPIKAEQLAMASNKTTFIYDSKKVQQMADESSAGKE